MMHMRHRKAPHSGEGPQLNGGEGDENDLDSSRVHRAQSSSHSQHQQETRWLLGGVLSVLALWGIITGSRGSRNVAYKNARIQKIEKRLDRPHVMQDRLSMDGSTATEASRRSLKGRQQQTKSRLLQNEVQHVLLTTFVFGQAAVEDPQFQIFVKTAATCGFDVAIVGYPVPSFPLPINVRHVEVTWNELVDRVMEKIQLQGKSLSKTAFIVNPNTKAKDFRPLFATLFPEQLHEYQWWGTVDNHLLLGNLTTFFPQDMLHSHDIIVGDGNAAWGPFTLYRNTEQINNLFQVVPTLTLQTTLLDPQYKSFDEFGQDNNNNNKEASIGGVIKKNYKKLKLRVGHRQEKLWDQGECDTTLATILPNWKLLDDPQQENCGECVYHANPQDGRTLIRSRDNAEVFLCRYDHATSKQWGSTPHDKLQQLLHADQFRVTYKYGFDLLGTTSATDLFQQQQQQAADGNIDPQSDNNKSQNNDEPSRKRRRKKNNNNKRGKQQRVLMTSMVYGEKYIEQRRFRMFIKSFETSGFDLAIIGSPPPTYPLPSNIKHVHITWSGLVDKIVETIFHDNTNIDPIKIQALKETIPYKSCDFRPLLAYLFPEEMDGYQWWGYIDNDSLVGNLTNIFPDKELKKWDIISGTSQSATGPFQLLRNTPKVNNLFWKVTEQQHGGATSLERILLDTQYQSFDEWGQLGERDASMHALIMKHAATLKLRYTSNMNRMWDQGECEESWAFLGLLDDPKRRNCGECIYRRHPKDGRTLVRARDDQEMFLCHYEGGKAYQEETLANDSRFQELLAADNIRATYWHGFDLLEPDETPERFDAKTAPRPKRALLATFVFGEENARKKRLWMFVKTLTTAGFDFVIVGDTQPYVPFPNNVRHIKITWSDLVDRILHKVFQGGNSVDPTKIQELRDTPLKVKDYKPLFAHLFPEEVEDYQFWGHIDNDAMVGNLTKFFPDEMLDSYDVISGDSHAAWGPLTLYRNTPTINVLFQKVTKYTSLEDLLIDARYQSFDEWGQQGNKKASMDSLIKEHAAALHLRLGSKRDTLWDIGECDTEFQKQVPGLKLLDDPKKDNCGECIYRSDPPNGKVLVRTRDDQEVFFCHYQSGEQEKLEESLSNENKFAKLYILPGFRTTFKHGFDFLVDDTSKLKESWDAIAGK